jgi:hypothetical protein
MNIYYLLHILYFILNNFYVTASPTTATTSVIIESTQPTIRTESWTMAEESEETTLGSLNTPTGQGEADECPACGTCSCPPTAPPPSPSHLDWGLGGGQDAARNSGDHYAGTINYIGIPSTTQAPSITKVKVPSITLYTGTGTINYTCTGAVKIIQVQVPSIIQAHVPSITRLKYRQLQRCHQLHRYRQLHRFLHGITLGG